MNILIIVDVQNDFATGSLKVGGAEDIIPKINSVMDYGVFDRIIATQDWHPKNHISFAETHGWDKKPFSMIKIKGDVVSERKLWPVHCVADTEGADFAFGLNQEKFDAVVRKGYKENLDSYSAIKDEVYNKTMLGEYLYNLFSTPYNEKNNIYVCGIATDVCVFHTVNDIMQMLRNFEGDSIRKRNKVFLIEDLCVGVDPKDSVMRMKQLYKDGVNIIPKRMLELEGIYR